MSHFFVLLIQIPYVVLSIFCGISLVISNWNEYIASKNKQTKTAYMVIESVEAESGQVPELVSMAA